MAIKILNPGEALQGYVIEKTLGIGGFGVVYLVHEANNPSRKQAIKLLQPRGTKQEEARARQSFLNEIMNMAKLCNHGGVVNVVNSLIHSTPEGDQLGVVMEYVDGISLFDFIQQQGKMVHERAIPLILLILKSLDFAHRQGIIHRDIKPENIMVQTSKVLHLGSISTNPIKIMDFGLSKVFEGASSMDSTGWGTREYMPPERARGTGEQIDATSDIYSVGVLFYVMLTGEYPFNIGSLDPVSAIDTICKAEVPSVKASYEYHPAELDAVIRKAMAKTPAQRYQTCHAMALDVAACLPGSEELLKDLPPRAIEDVTPPQDQKPPAGAGSGAPQATGSVTGGGATRPGSATAAAPAPGAPAKPKGLLYGGLAAALLAAALGGYAMMGKKADTTAADSRGTLTASFDILLNEARAGDAKAQHQVGVKYFEGKDVKKDYSESVKWFNLAAQGGYAESQYNLAQLYESGTGAEKDLSKAESLYKKAAAQNYVDAMYRLGLLYYNQNRLSDAKPWFEKASTQGSSEAQLQLGVIYFYQKNETKALEFFSKAADAGNVSAQANLGVLQAKRGNHAEAIRLWRQAAAAGNPVAMYQLGLAYQHGKGVAADRDEARRWLTEAANHGFEDAKQALKAL